MEPDNTPTQQQSAPELSPCPFCGGTIISLVADGESKYAVSCENCYCIVGEGYDKHGQADNVFANRERAIRAWNIRVDFNTRVRVDVGTPNGISWTALLACLERLRSKTKNPDANWYHGWNAAIQCLINDINSRAHACSVASQEDVFTTYNQAIEDAKAAIHEEARFTDNAGNFINAIARRCSPHKYVASLVTRTQSLEPQTHEASDPYRPVCIHCGLANIAGDWDKFPCSDEWRKEITTNY